VDQALETANGDHGQAEENSDMEAALLKGSLWILFLYDVSEEIVVERLGRILTKAERNSTTLLLNWTPVR
jgi:hypothetical protein